MNEAWTVAFVNGDAVAEFQTLPVDMRARLQRIFRLVESRGLEVLGMPLARPVDSPLWELRVTGRDGIARCLYVAATGRTLLILRTFIKKTQKTPRREIDMARRRLREVDHGTD